MAGIEAGTVALDTDAFDACLSAFDNSSPCDLTIDRESIEQFETSCESMFVGQVATGETCYSDVECADRGLCDNGSCLPGECCMGVCQAGEPRPPLAAIGEACEDFGDCVYDAYCQLDFTTGESTCAALRGEGEECDDFFACESGLGCDLDFATFMGTCVPMAAEGETCSPNVLFACNREDLICDEADNTCKRLQGPGGTCDGFVDCVEYASCVEGTCVQLPGLGGDCTELSCLGSLDCEGNVCVEEPDLACATPVPEA